MELASYDYSTWNWWSWPKIIDSGKLGLKIEIKFLEIFQGFKENSFQYKKHL